MTSIYIDSCIYLNIWKKEKDGVGNPLWKTSTELLNLIEQKKYKSFLLGIYFQGAFIYFNDGGIFRKN